MNANTSIQKYSALAIAVTLTLPTQAATLNEAVQQALSSNPQVQASLQSRNAREQEMKAAKADYYPQVYLTAAIGEENTDSPYTRTLPPNGESIDLTRQEVAFVIKQSLYSGFSTSAKVDAVRARFDAAGYQLTATSERVTLQTANVYLAVMRDKQLLQLANDNLDQHKQIFDRVKQRSEQGVGRKADQMQAEGRLALAESHVIAAETNQFNTSVNYNRVVGTMPENDTQMPASFAEALPDTLQEAIDITLKNNPDVQTANTHVIAARAQHTSSRSNYYPQLDLVFEQTWDENLDGVEGNNDGYSIMLKMRYDLFNGGGDIARSRQTAYLVDESRAQQDYAQRLIVEDLNLAWTTYKALRRQLIFRKQHVDASAQTLDAYTKQFNLGQRTLLDLLDAHNELFEANRAYLAAQFDSIYQQYRILADMGQLAARFSTKNASN